MEFTKDMMEELNALLLFNLTTTQEGIKVHKNADPVRIEAVQRLHHKGLVSQPDGGYLTDLGREVAEYARNAITILDSD